MGRKKRGTGKRIRRFFHKYINGTKGAVSLFLALVMSPLLSVSLLLVEAARYQDAVQTMEEIMDSSAFSTLAEYDSFLNERFGLLSVSQQADINEEFSGYMAQNVSVLGKDVTVNTKSAAGDYALSDTDVLKQQLLEYSEISVALETVTEGIDLEEMVSELTKVFQMEKINEEIEAVDAGVELTKEISKLLESIEDVKTQYEEKYSPALEAYNSAYTAFEEKAVSLIEALKEEKDKSEETDEEEEGGEEEPDEESKAEAAGRELDKARDDYRNAASTLKKELSELKKDAEALASSVSALPSKLEKYRSNNSASSTHGECTTSTYEWLNIITDQMTTVMDQTVGDAFRDKSAEEIKALGEQIKKLESFSSSTITSDWDASKVRAEYGCISIISVSPVFGANLDGLMNQLNAKADVGEETSVQMGNLLSIFQELMGISGLYDANLDAAVNTTYLYNNTEMSLASKMTIDSITTFATACDNFVSGITSVNIIKAVVALGELLVAVGKLLTSVVAWAGQVCANLFDTLSDGPKEWYNTFLLYGYGAYNLPNRTNYTSSSPVSNYPYSEIYQLAGGKSMDSAITGGLKDLSTSKVEGNDRLFKGAEAEYVLIGSTSEIQNQSAVFFNLYLLRLLLDLFPVLTNKEVSVMAAMAGPGAFLVKFAIVLIEPMLDTIILVNGGKEYLIKKDIYMTVSGCSFLLSDLTDITAISDNLKGKIKDTVKAESGMKERKKGLCNASYTEHILVLMMLSINQQTFMQRMQNLIQMEAAEYNKENNGFDLDKAYTYIHTDVSYTLNPMFAFDGLTNNGLFTVRSQKYSGY